MSASRTAPADVAKRATSHVGRSGALHSRLLLMTHAGEMFDMLCDIDAAYEMSKPFDSLPPVVEGQHDPYSVRRAVRALIERAGGFTHPR